MFLIAGRREAGEPIPLAVLPLVNLSPDPANDYFADGLPDEMPHQHT
jgi:TolB-like protein